ncbi:MAG: CHASE2 domain-containing protein [Candidatus Omnitrophota bacterium]|nr:CHASE2 domain-containing protein [Candidatus Omnitrophota bacterium]
MQKELIAIELFCMLSKIKRSAPILFISLLFATASFYLLVSLPFLNIIHRQSYDALFKIEYKLRPPPLAINDILLVVIDNATLKNMPQRWPYSRATFATVIKNLKKAEAKTIAFDFVFWGKTDPQEDATLIQAVDEGKVILPCLINEDGMIEFSDLPGPTTAFYSGVVTKIQDRNGVIRRNLTYIVNKNEPLKGILSWEMQILKAVRSIDLSTLVSNGDIVSFQNDAGEKWMIPVEPSTKAFPIHFRAHAADFNRISFINVLKGNFDPDKVKGKIIILGTLSSLFGDLYPTPIGWLPGIAINANAFLDLYTHDFLKNIPAPIELCVILLTVIISGLLVVLFKTKKAILLISLEISLILTMTYALLIHGYLWNYFLIAVLTMVCPFAAKKVCLNWRTYEQ